MKQKILEIFENNQGEILSGEEIAKVLGVSRNCVWKNINLLKNEGYDIISHSTVGYSLSCTVDVFSANRIESLSKNDINVIFYDEVSSTNDVAKDLARNGAKEGTVVIARTQTNGKGRLGRTFISNEDNGIYMSIMLRPQMALSESVNITVMGAVAVLEAIEKTSNITASIKWVNDIYINDKKVCGILTEASFDFESSRLDYAILGIGINVTPPKNGFDEEISAIATSIYPTKSPVGYKSALCAQIIDSFMNYYKKSCDKSYIKKYKEKSNILGKNVNVYRGNETVFGKAIDIDENANLVVETENGIVKFNSGEARVRKDEK